MENETLFRLDEVNESISLLQRKNGLTFGTDALLLSSYIEGCGEYALELGTGTGIISLLLLRKGKAKKITALEVQPEFAEIAKMNTEQNGLSDDMLTLCTDLRDYNAGAKYNLVFSNPPYMRCDSGKANCFDEKNIARHEVKGSIHDFCACAQRSLKFGGTFYAVYRTDRLADLFTAMRDCRIEPKRMTLVLANQNATPSMALVEGRLGGSTGLVITPPLLLYRDEKNTLNSEDYDYILKNGSFPEKFLIKNRRKSKESHDAAGKKSN